MAKQWNLSEFTNLYQARHFLSNDNKKELGLLMPVDIYVQDPHVAESDEELALNEIWVKCEPDLMDGPISARIAVVDQDADRNKVEDPVRWDRRNRRFFFERNGEKVPITRAHRDLPQFHQVNVWATVQSVLDMYEATWVLGRSAPWGFEGNRLIAVPHAGYKANAFYDRHKQALQFYYFDQEDRRVYTCLSHDIIAHETGHAILDGLRPLYFENRSLETAAFHEFVADLTAIMISLLNNSLRWEVAGVSEGDLSKDTIIAALAKEFGHYASGRPHLRSATNTKTMDEVRYTISPYPWSEVLTGAMWDILSGMFAKYRAEPKRSTGKPPSDKEALLWAVNHFRRVAFQPLDYLPPVDVQFCDYARAVLRADELIDPADEDDYRGLMRDVFDKRGIACAADEDQTERLYFYAYDIDRVSRSRTDAYHFLHENRRQLCIPADQDIMVVDLYRTDKTSIGGGRLPREIVLQYAWREALSLKGSAYGALNGETMSLLCGGTLIFDERGNILHWVRKPGSRAQKVSAGRRRKYCGGERARGLERRSELRGYVAGLVAGGQIGLAEDDVPEARDARPPIVARRAGDGTISLETLPHLRHWEED
ncbi:MAG: serine protease [Anaerolineae bacterium]